MFKNVQRQIITRHGLLLVVLDGGGRKYPSICLPDTFAPLVGGGCCTFDTFARGPPASPTPSPDVLSMQDRLAVSAL